MKKMIVINPLFIGDLGFNGLPGQKGESGPPGKNFEN